MSKEKTEKIGFKEFIEINKKAWKISYNSNPELYKFTFLRNLIFSVTPYITILLSTQILNEISGERRAERLWFLVALNAIVFVVTELAKCFINRYSTAYMSFDTFYRKNIDIYRKKMLDMDFCVAESSEAKALRSAIDQNQKLGNWGLTAVIGSFATVVTAVISLVASFAMVYTLFTLKVSEDAGALTILNNPIFIVLTILILLLSPLINSKVLEKTYDVFNKLSAKMKYFNSSYHFYSEVVYDNRRMKDMRMYEQHKIAYKFADYDRAKEWKELKRIEQKGFVITGFFSGLMLGLIYTFVCLKAIGGAFGIGLVMQYIVCLSIMDNSIEDLLRGIILIKSNTIYLKTTLKYLELPNVMYRGSLTTEKRSDYNYDIEFRNVSFKYPNTENYVIKNLSLKFDIGKKFAVVGENGSGKTTFINLLCRLYEPTDGEILLNGIDISKYDYLDYIDVFSPVFQDFKLLSYTLGENVGAGAGYDRERAEYCLVRAGFGERLATLENGLDTYLYKALSDEGVTLSGGEEQKVALARALYRNSAFIILDEPTSALDPIAESEIYEQFNSIVGDATAIYISHRLSSCKFCDEIMVFDDGSLVELGTHDELVEKEGKYRDLWLAQSQYYN